MSLRPNARMEVRKKAYKVAVDADEARRKREDNLVEILKSKREESLLKKRLVAQQLTSSSQLTTAEKKGKLVMGVEAFTGECKMGFARKLASPKNKTREKALSLLVLWLTSQKQIEESELKKIWKGLFYCVWHSDKPPVQADLIERLASIFDRLDVAFSLQYFKVFLMTMRREWAGIDRLRLDKFYLLLRKCLCHMLVALERSGWNVGLMKEFMDILMENAFLAKDQYAASGINLHYADIYLEELTRFLPLTADRFKIFLEPFLVVCANTSDKCLLERVKTNIFDHLLNIGHIFITAKQEGNSVDSGIESLGSLLFEVPVKSEAFRLASMPSTPQANRKLLYKLHTEWETLEKLLGMSGISTTLAASPEKKKKKKKKKKKDSLGQVRSCMDVSMVTTVAKPKIRGQQSKKTKASKDHAGGMVGTVILDKEKEMETNVEVLKGDLFNEWMAYEGNSISNETKASEFIKNNDLESEGKGSLGCKRKKAKPASGKKVAHVVSRSGDNAEDPRLEQRTPLLDQLNMNNSVVSKLERQFDLLADERLVASDNSFSPGTWTAKSSFPLLSQSKRRKRPTGIPLKNGSLVLDDERNGCTPTTGRLHGHSSGKVKRVRFALKKNLVWNPSTPLPDESVRVPPSATPRGSALKKGVSPGPINSTAANAPRQWKGSPLWPLTHSKPSKNRKSVLRRVKLLAKQHRSV